MKQYAPTYKKENKMITVTRFDGSQFVINAFMIEIIEPTPDTVISMIGGKKIIVKEPVDQIVESVVNFYKKIGISGSINLISNENDKLG